MCNNNKEHIQLSSAVVFAADLYSASVEDLATWIQSLLGELNIKLSSIPMIWCNNQGAIALAYNLVYHAKTKHVEFDIHFIRDKIAAKEIEVCFVPSEDQTTNVLTKTLTFKLLSYLQRKLNAYPKYFSLRGDVSESSEDEAKHDISV